MRTDEHYRSLLKVLQQQEAALGALVVIAERQQVDLVASDYEGIERNAREMAQATVIARELDLQRADILADMGRGDATITELIVEAAEAGVIGFRETRDDIERTMTALRAVQEVNARFILSASKLVERWAGALAGLVGSTYSAEGKAAMGEAGNFVSRQA